MILSPAFSLAIEGAALLDRHSDRGKMRAAAQARARETGKRLLVLRTPDQMLALRSVAPSSVVVMVDCGLEICGERGELDACIAELRRVTGKPADLFVLTIQRWAGARIALDPRVRWVIVTAPPHAADITVRPFGRRSTTLADARMKRWVLA